MSLSPHSQQTIAPLIQPFLVSTFDPVEYLNRSTPPLSITSISQPIKRPQTLTLTELASQTQTHIAQLSAQSTRLIDTLTHLTDDILRSGGRLAYEVEILRGETISLGEVLAEGLQADITKFVPEGLVTGTTSFAGQSPTSPSDVRANTAQRTLERTVLSESPEVTKLRTLHHVRHLLQSVITVFDSAITWSLPPPASSSSLALGSASEPNDGQESLAQASLSRLRHEITSLLSSPDHEIAHNIIAAENRAQELRELLGVWKGTAEEKARGQFVDSLAQLVAERRREEELQGNLILRGGENGRGSFDGRVSGETERNRDRGEGKAGGGGPGFLRNLQRLRDEIYLD